MNIDCRLSALVRKIEKHYHRENLPGSKYLIIKRECENSGLGLFAYYVTMLAQIEYALRNGMIPVIDMKNYANTFHQNGEVGKINTWELFFEQPCGVTLEEALRSGKSRYVWEDIPAYHPNASLDFLYHEKIVSYYHLIAKQYIRFQPHVLKVLKEKEKEILGESHLQKQRILGVLARGTDYTGLRPYYNPIQPDWKLLEETINQYCDRYHCEKIYLATEDTDVLEHFIHLYGDRLLYTDQKRVNKVTTYLYENEEFIGRDPFERGVEYLTSIYILTKCNGLVAGRTTGTVGACIMADQYEFRHIFSLGRYGIEDRMLLNKESGWLKTDEE